MELLRGMRLMTLLAFALVVAGGLDQRVSAEETASSGSGFSLEELMLLADAAEKAQKSSNDEDGGNVSNFQHRLKQIIQTARVAAGSGQSTGSDVLDQTIRQVRARINASGGGASVSDTSIFDAAVKAITSNGGGSATPIPDSSSLVDTIVRQFTPEASTTPAPTDNSFIGGVLSELANSDGTSGGAGRALLDAVVKQFVSTTTTTTTTTTTPKPDVTQLIGGLIRTITDYNKDKQEGQVDGRSATADPAEPSNPAKLLEGFKSILQEIQNKQGGGGDATTPNPSSDSQPAPRSGLTGNQLLEGFINQLKNLQNSGGTPSSAEGSSPSPGTTTPNLAFLQDMLKQFQSKLGGGDVGKGAGSEPSAVQPPTAPPVDLEGFEGLIPDAGSSEGRPVTAAPTSKPKGNDAMQLIGGFVRQLSESGQQGGGQGAQGFLQGLGRLFSKSNQGR